MNKQIERILICLLWLLAATLGTCFWLNTTFGFNIFSAQHWQYLAYLQAAQTPVRPAFYTSLVCAILISVGVLYVLVRPHGIKRHRTISNETDNVTQPQPDTTTFIEQTTKTSTPETASHHVSQKLQRPPRIGFASSHPQPAIKQAQQPQPTSNASTINFDELRQIFASNGYLVKPNPQIGNFKPALLAIGTNETLWIGGVGITESVLSTAMEKLATIFSDTLDDIEINIFGFIIAPTGSVLNTDIQTFKDTAELSTYMTSNKNTPPSDSGERENFEAYSEYIDTVINYMDKT